MTIRFTCAECASVLKIKDELAGTSGRCPKCKTKFVVPKADSDIENIRQNEDAHSNHQITGSTAAAISSDNLPFADRISDQPAHEQEQVENDDSSKTDLPPAALTASSPLSLEDNEDEPKENNDSLASSVSLSPTSEGDGEGTNDDDLDCPPMLVFTQQTKSRTAALPQQSFRSERSSFAADKEFFSAQPTRPSAPVIQPFDPSKFVVTNPPVSKKEPETVPANDVDEIPALSLSDDSEIDLEDRPEPAPISRRPPAAAVPRAQPEKVDLATAAKMMKKAIRDNQAAESHQREVDANARFDFAAFFREFGLKGLGILAGATLLTFVLYFMADRMFGTKLYLPKMGYVSGVIRLNGQPLPGATIYFSPEEVQMEGKKRDRIRTSVGVADSNGNFKMMYIPADRIEGVAAGRCRVWVDHIGPTGRSDVPPEWMEAAMQIKEVTPGTQKTPFEVDMKSKIR